MNQLSFPHEDDRKLQWTQRNIQQSIEELQKRTLGVTITTNNSLSNCGWLKCICCYQIFAQSRSYIMHNRRAREDVLNALVDKLKIISYLLY